MAPYRILVVDDSPFMRKIFTDLIVKDPQFTIVGTAANGVEAIEAVSRLKPDAVTLDLEMPEMNGIDALQTIMKQHPTPVIMLSGISEENTRETIKALQYGAFDFIRKPSGPFSNDIVQVGELLLEKLKIAVLMKRNVAGLKNDASAIEKSKKFGDPVPSEKKSTLPERKAQAPTKPIEKKQALRDIAAPSHTERPIKAPQPEKAKVKPVYSESKLPSTDSFRHIVAIGTSTGGPRALHEVISSLPADLSAPVLVVQHMPPKFTKSLAQRLDAFSSVHVVEAADGEKLHAGVVYIAPGGYHMELAKDAAGYCIKLTQQPPRNGHRPSVDVLFESLVPYTGLKRHAVVMTGMGSDGAKGIKALVESGAATAIAEAEETCVVYGMPRSAIDIGAVKTILPLPQISNAIAQAVIKST
ncbi:chemotaxis response regulator protein-glutamate methylesterase [Paenibacillus sp. NEAU-GSW1]|uniref:protein-glutamate methylesterase/protein-glutamine glutaminase n=1 Tax=Paenibacillus sp. NEAU-GSW1 TaxID=2682486 RepID=UPI0012E319BA|nr:chemotaxis response regulator protein-glutamate methylesterase [Paenibacillus sp. NEAU-GSW1]MUT66373.1 chemotaxis-specific protein-glutamate methyltransferase CheB [Paenibacillus sp. NEAU-GSW1]